jgi:(4S)-4-hydroxy-5-phosphonooxypentane-2,3-dione isomerase
MLIIHVNIQVKPEHVEAFKQATVANALESRKEAGIARFDCLQREDDPTRFVLVEAYRDADAQARHRETRHYQVWRDAVAPMMAEPRASVKFTDVLESPRRSATSTT